METEERITMFISSVTWTFAKTYAETSPHEYLILHKCPEEFKEDWLWFVQHIKENGYIEYYFKTPFTYLNVGEHKYWAMGYPGKPMTIINRADKTKTYK